MIVLGTIGCCLASTALALVVSRCIPPSLDDVSEMELPSSDRQHFADQRLERRGFGEGAQSSNHRSASK